MTSSNPFLQSFGNSTAFSLPMGVRSGPHARLPPERPGYRFRVGYAGSGVFECAVAGHQGARVPLGQAKRAAANAGGEVR